MSRHFKFIVLFAVLPLANGCCFPGPWRAERLVPDVPFYVFSVPEKTPESTPYFVGDVYVQAILPAKNETNASATSPYFIILSVHAGAEPIVSVSVDSVQFQINEENVRGLEFHTSRGSDLEYAVELPYDFPIVDGTIPNHSLIASSPFAIDFKENPTMQLMAQITIEFESRVETKVVAYSFKQKLEKGFWSCVEV